MKLCNPKKPFGPFIFFLSLSQPTEGSKFRSSSSSHSLDRSRAPIIFFLSLSRAATTATLAQPLPFPVSHQTLTMSICISSSTSPTNLTSASLGRIGSLNLLFVQLNLTSPSLGKLSSLSISDFIYIFTGFCLFLTD
ncbi:hypothetical protein Dimus_015654 [Dionaea muscipula]